MVSLIITAALGFSIWGIAFGVTLSFYLMNKDKDEEEEYVDIR